MQKPIRIAMFGHKHIPSREGGIEVVVEELCTRMVKSGYIVTCYNRQGHHVSGVEFDNQKMKVYKGIRIKQVFTIDKKGIAAVTSSFFAAISCALGPYDIVHIHAEGPAAFCFLPKLFGKRVIVTVHGLDHARKKWSGLAKKYILLGEKNAVRYADEIIVLSAETQKYFKENYQRDTIFIPNGVDRPVVRSPKLIKEKWGLDKDGYILFLARLVPEKGVHYLIEAYKRIGTDKKLIIAGGSSDTNEYIKQIQEMAYNNKQICFTGFVQGRILEELYSNAYMYVLPSDLEGMPLALLEAMSYGNCCVVSDIPECIEVVEDKAVQFHRGDVDDLTEKLRMLCDKKEKVAAYKNEAAAFICGKYNWDDVVKRTVSLYEMKSL